MNNTGALAFFLLVTRAALDTILADTEAAAGKKWYCRTNTFIAKATP